MLYILFKNFTKDDIEMAVSFLESVSSKLEYSPDIKDAVGVCTTEINNTYCFLTEQMCNKDNIYTSWILCRKECFTLKDFVDRVMEEVEEYNSMYKDAFADAG